MRDLKPSHPAFLWISFAVVSACPLFVAALFRTDPGFGDVFLYQDWARAGVSQHTWPVLDVRWVYPLGALLPIALLSHITSAAAFASAWWALITALNAVTMIVIRRKLPQGDSASWWWLGFLLLLGPIGFSRIDSVAAAAATIALVLIQRRPVFATALISYAGWVKVAHFAWLMPIFILSSRRIRAVLAPWALMSTCIAATGLTLGSGSRIYSFLTEQADRGLQGEAVLATPFSVARLWSGPGRLEYSQTLNTYEYVGHAARSVARVSDVLLIVAALAISLLVAQASRRQTGEKTELLALGTFAMTVALIVFNKVGSPQFTLWLAAPLVLSYAIPRRSTSWNVPLMVSLLVAASTQLVYPLFYRSYIFGSPTMLIVGAARNALVVALFIWAIGKLLQAARYSPISTSLVLLTQVCRTMSPGGRSDTLALPRRR